MINRRQAIGTLASAVAMTALPGQAVATDRQSIRSAAIPDTLAAIGTAGKPVGTADFPIGYLGVTWTGPANGGVVRFRGRGGWTAWRSLPCADSPAPDQHCALVPAGGAADYEVGPPAGSRALRTVAINTTDGPRTRRAAPARTGVATGVRLFSRADWGADESLRFGPDGTELFPPAYFPVQTLTVHHTVTANNDPDPAATVRAIYYFQAFTQDIGDIGYHLLIDQNGAIYEERWSGPDPIPVFEGRSPRMSNGAHIAGFNAGNVGIALLGDLTGIQPNAAARRSLVIALAGLAAVCGLDPLGRVAYVNPISGTRANVDTINGHQNWAPTECPGNTFYPTLPRVRTDVARLLGGT